jgi:hypothetical protein
MTIGNLKTSAQQEVAVFDWSRAMAISRDGRKVLFDETNQANERAGVYVFDRESRSAQRVSDGFAWTLAGDGETALVWRPRPPNEVDNLFLVSVHRKQPDSQVKDWNLDRHWSVLLPSGEMILGAVAAGQAPAIYRQTHAGDTPVLVKADLALRSPVLNGRATILAGLAVDSCQIVTVHLSDGLSHPVNQSGCAYPTLFLNDHTILIAEEQRDRFSLLTLDMATGVEKPYATIEYPKLPGTIQVRQLLVAENAQDFVFSKRHTISDLFLVSGWK